MFNAAERKPTKTYRLAQEVGGGWVGKSLEIACKV